MENGAVEPAFGVTEGGNDGGPVEGLVRRGVRVGREARHDYFALFRCQEGGGVRVVADEKVGDEGDDDGQDASVDC